MQVHRRPGNSASPSLLRLRILTGDAARAIAMRDVIGSLDEDERRCLRDLAEALRSPAGFRAPLVGSPLSKVVASIDSAKDSPDTGPPSDLEALAANLDQIADDPGSTNPEDALGLLDILRESLASSPDRIVHLDSAT